MTIPVTVAMKASAIPSRARRRRRGGEGRRPCTTRNLYAPAEGRQAQARNAPDGLEHDRPRHLRPADLPVDERDRHLDDAEACAERAVRRLDLERIALGRD